MNAKWSEIVMKAWQDPSFKKKLMANPEAVLKEYGIKVPADCAIKIVENSPKTLYLTIPTKPTGELSEEQLQKIAGGIFDPGILRQI